MDQREQIKSGDLLVWKKSSKSTISRWTLDIIRLFTRSDFAHVGVAWVLEGRLFVVEATQPVVRLTNVKETDEFYHVGMNVEWSKLSEDFLIGKLGLKYSMFDAIRAFLGKRLDNDDRYQCAELAHEFYAVHGISLGDSYTPSELVDSALRARAASLDLIQKK